MGSGSMSISGYGSAAPRVSAMLVALAIGQQTRLLRAQTTATGSSLPVHCSPAGDSQCQNGGSCDPLVLGGLHVCHCPAGYTGDLCEQAAVASACADLPCENGGTCVQLFDLHSCHCAQGFTGNNCSVHCASAAQCHEQGTAECTAGTENDLSYHCTCREGWTGPRCDAAAYDPCEANDETGGPRCENGGSCEAAWGRPPPPLIQAVLPTNQERHGGSEVFPAFGPDGQQLRVSIRADLVPHERVALPEENIRSAAATSGEMIWQPICHCAEGFQGDTCAETREQTCSDAAVVQKLCCSRGWGPASAGGRDCSRQDGQEPLSFVDCAPIAGQVFPTSLSQLPPTASREVATDTGPNGDADWTKPLSHPTVANTVARMTENTSTKGWIFMFLFIIAAFVLCRHRKAIKKWWRNRPPFAELLGNVATAAGELCRKREREPPDTSAGEATTVSTDGLSGWSLSERNPATIYDNADDDIDIGIYASVRYITLWSTLCLVIELCALLHCFTGRGQQLGGYVDSNPVEV